MNNPWYSVDEFIKKCGGDSPELRKDMFDAWQNQKLHVSLKSGTGRIRKDKASLAFIRKRKNNAYRLRDSRTAKGYVYYARIYGTQVRIANIGGGYCFSFDGEDNIETIEAPTYDEGMARATARCAELGRSKRTVRHSPGTLGIMLLLSDPEVNYILGLLPKSGLGLNIINKINIANKRGISKYGKYHSDSLRHVFGDAADELFET